MATGQSQRQVAQRLRAIPKRPKWIRATARFLEDLENLDISEVHRLTDLHVLADAYEMPRLMLDFLISRPERQKPIIVECLSQFNIVEHSDGHAYGQNARYSIPPNRLAGTTDVSTGVAFACVELEPYGGISDEHSHQGDELMLILQGTVEVELKGMNTTQRLSEGSYIHFYAEQRHSVRNVSSTVAVIFVVRCYDFDDTTMRLPILNAIRVAQFTKDRGPAGSAQKVDKGSRTGLALLKQEIDFSTIRTESDADCANYAALGLYLADLMDSYAWSMDNISSVAASLGCPRLTDVIRQLVQIGEVGPLTSDDLNGIANVFSIPAILLAGFLFPAAPHCVVVSRCA